MKDHLDGNQEHNFEEVGSGEVMNQFDDLPPTFFEKYPFFRGIAGNLDDLLTIFTRVPFYFFMKHKVKSLVFGVAVAGTVATIVWSVNHKAEQEKQKLANAFRGGDSNGRVTRKFTDERGFVIGKTEPVNVAPLEKEAESAMEESLEDIPFLEEPQGKLALSYTEEEMQLPLSSDTIEDSLLPGDFELTTPSDITFDLSTFESDVRNHRKITENPSAPIPKFQDIEIESLKEDPFKERTKQDKHNLLPFGSSFSDIKPHPKFIQNPSPNGINVQGLPGNLIHDTLPRSAFPAIPPVAFDGLPGTEKTVESIVEAVNDKPDKSNLTEEKPPVETTDDTKSHTPNLPADYIAEDKTDRTEDVPPVPEAVVQSPSEVMAQVLDMPLKTAELIVRINSGGLEADGDDAAYKTYLKSIDNKTKIRLLEYLFNNDLIASERKVRHQALLDHLKNQ